jgi:tetratricopeptide (TPR) repeat protein
MQRNSRFALLLLACLVFSAPALVAQIPDEFENLQLLDPEIGKRDLVGTMRDWATGLGVRCNHCHVGPDNLVGMDFASDEKATKKTARRMLEMSRAINRELLADLPVVQASGRERAQIVSCYTCHRGLDVPPRNTIRVLADAARAEGPEAAVAKFESMKEEFFGAGQYDLRSDALDMLAVEYAQAQKPDEARKVLEANIALHPDSDGTHLFLGMLELQLGNADAARASFKRVLEITPDHPGAVRGLATLEKSTGQAEGED